MLQGGIYDTLLYYKEDYTIQRDNYEQIVKGGASNYWQGILTKYKTERALASI